MRGPITAGAIVAVGLALAASFFAGNIAARAAGPPALAGCPMFPANNIWNAPMGQRFRLKASVPISQYHPHIQVIFTAFKRYGLILADNGSNWYITGTHDPFWDDEMLSAAFRSLRGSDFEAVDVSSLMVDPNSGQVRPLFTHWTRMPIVRK